MTGMIAVLPLGTMGNMAQGVRVESHTVGAGEFTYVPPKGTAGKGHTNNAFFFEASCGLLDAEGEWCYEPASRSLRLWFAGCVDPRHGKAKSVRGRVTDYLLNATGIGARHLGEGAFLRLEFLTLWGGALHVVQSNLELNTVQWLFPTASKRTLNQVGVIDAPIVLNNNLARGRIRMVNSTIEWHDGVVAFDRIGSGAIIRNCAFRRSSYAGGESAAVSDGGNSVGLQFIGNTVALFNSFSGVTPGKHAVITMNEFSDQGPTADGACVHVHVKQQDGVVIRRNWAHHSTVKAFRFDRVNSPGATWGVNGTVLENVVWLSGAAAFKGDHHNISKNTVFRMVSHRGKPDAHDGAVDAALFIMVKSVPTRHCYDSHALNELNHLWHPLRRILLRLASCLSGVRSKAQMVDPRREQTHCSPREWCRQHLQCFRSTARSAHGQRCGCTVGADACRSAPPKFQAEGWLGAAQHGRWRVHIRRRLLDTRPTEPPGKPPDPSARWRDGLHRCRLLGGADVACSV
jgi:hypothetical protein